MTRKATWGLGAGALALAAGFSLPIWAQTGGGPAGAGQTEEQKRAGDRDRLGDRADRNVGMDDKECCGDEVVLDRPFGEVQGKINDAATKANLFVLGNIDWTRVHGVKGGMNLPGQNRLDEKLAGASNINTYFLGDDKVVTHVQENPKHGLFAPGVVLYEKGGKCNLIVFRPSHAIEHMKKAGKDQAKIDKYSEFAKDYERKLDQFINILKGGRSS